MTQFALQWEPAHPSFRLVGSTWDEAFLAALRRHYTGSAGPPPGKKLAWAIFDAGEFRGFVALGEPAFKVACRRRLGVPPTALPSSVCCFIYRLERPGPTSASQLLRSWHPVAAADWRARYGWEPVHWETLVDPERVRSAVPGACFRRAGYRRLGLTTGRGARRPPGSTHGPRIWGDTSKKIVFYRGPLARVQPEETYDRRRR